MYASVILGALLGLVAATPATATMSFSGTNVTNTYFFDGPLVNTTLRMDQLSLLYTNHSEVSSIESLVDDTYSFYPDIPSMEDMILQPMAFIDQHSEGSDLNILTPLDSIEDEDNTLGRASNLHLQSDRGRRQLSRHETSRPCTTPTKETGLCKDLADCPGLILDLTNLRRSVCFKSLFIPGVCCPVSGLRTEPVTSTFRPTISTARPRPITQTRPHPSFPVHTTSRPTNTAVVHPNANYRCGVPRIAEFRVVGGEEAPRGKWPWMAAIFLHGPKKDEFWCGGSLISSRYVLTAAHCTRDPKGNTFSPLQFTVRLGDHDITSTADDHLVHPHTYRVESITPHPEFKARGFYNDVALIKLKDTVNFNDFTAPVCLPPPDMARQHLDHLLGQDPTVIGYGSTHYDGTGSPVLREAKLPVWRNTDCNNAYLQPITEIFLCAGYVEGGRDACQGDSGGPLLLYVPSQQWVQVGIVSFGNRCAEAGYPGVYARLTHYMAWIHENMIS